MKYYETKFEEYITTINTYNLHPKISKELYNLPDFSNVILYGPPGVGKYSQALNYIKKMSPSQLKYERKMNFIFNKNKEYFFKISDVHFEIDFSLLGCNAKVLFNDLYYHILDIFSAKQNKSGVILCKNFHNIHEELIDNFYSYMQNIKYKNINLSYILITEQISFIPKNIINKCFIVSVPRPSKTRYQKCVKKKITVKNINDIINIKNLKSQIDYLNNDVEKMSNKIIENIDNYNTINFLEFRDICYDVLIYNLDLCNCINYIVNHYILNNRLNDKNLNEIYKKLIGFLKYYNNNYRPIYHLESFFYYLCKVIHGL